MEFDKLILKNISLDINKKSILKNININIKHNKIHSFYGKSGSGKTSLLNIMNFLYIPTNGSITLLKEEGKTIVVVSHSEEIEKISDFHYRMEDINA